MAVHLSWWCLATLPYPSSYSVPLAVATRLSIAYDICYVRGMPRLQPSHPPLRVARQPILSPDASASLWQLLAFSPSASCLPYSSPRSICPLMRTSSNRFLSRLALLLYSALSFGRGAAVVPAVDPSMIPQMTQTRALAGGAAWQRLFTSQSRW